MPLELNLRNFLTRLGTEFKSIRATIGNLASLSTTEKTSLVLALNELRGQLMAATQINDGAQGTTTTYSSQKIDAQIQGAIAALVNGAPTALDTLKELADKLATEETALGSVLTALDKRVSVDAPQTFTSGQQAQARANIGAVAASALGDTERDLVADFEAALV